MRILPIISKFAEKIKTDKMIPHPVQVKAICQFSIWLKFDDNTEGEIDLSHLINKPVFQSWRNPDFFDQVHIDVETGAIAWDANIEICPDNLYFKIRGITFEQWITNQYNYATNQ